MGVGRERNAAPKSAPSHPRTELTGGFLSDPFDLGPLFTVPLKSCSQIHPLGVIRQEWKTSIDQRRIQKLKR